jgi:hypothetical protein
MPVAKIATAKPVVKPVSPAELPPLQLRTPEQLKEGMVVKVGGAGADDLAVARLIQDGADFVATTAGTTMGLKKVDINDKEVDERGALGMATFFGTDGWFGLSHRSTKGLMEGITRLRSTPFEQWKESERADFLQANEAVLHESGHVTLPAYDSSNVKAWSGANRDFEEGLTEITTMGQIGDFMKREYGLEVPEKTMRISQSTSAYTRFTERIDRMLKMGGSGDQHEAWAAGQLIADNTRADQRMQAIAQRIGTNLGGDKAPKEMVDEIAKTLPGFVGEQNGTRTRLMQIQSALVDYKQEGVFHRKAFRSDLAKLDAKSGFDAAPLTGRPTNGDGPLV